MSSKLEGSSSSAGKSIADKPEPEFHEDAWERFERATAVVVKAPPQHRGSAPPKAKSDQKGNALQEPPDDKPKRSQ